MQQNILDGLAAQASREATRRCALSRQQAAVLDRVHSIPQFRARTVSTIRVPSVLPGPASRIEFLSTRARASNQPASAGHRRFILLARRAAAPVQSQRSARSAVRANSKPKFAGNDPVDDAAIRPTTTRTAIGSRPPSRGARVRRAAAGTARHANHADGSRSAKAL